MNYKVNNKFHIKNGFEVNTDNILTAALETNDLLTKLPISLFNTIDYKTTSTLVGRIFCESLASKIQSAIVNPIEKGHPDIIPLSGKNATESQLRNYPVGLEVKCTIGNIRPGVNLRAGSRRLDYLTGITWQAHHQEVKQLLGLTWDFVNNIEKDSYLFPAITAAFYTPSLNIDDWGMISGTTGRNTKVCGMKASGRKKMSLGWILIENSYFDRYMKLLGSEISDNC